jgi:hypothetical protein
LAIENRHNPRLGDACVDFINADLAQARLNKGGSLVAVKGQFGMLVQVLTPAFHFV